MLYISSRSKTDSFTANRTLCADRAPDGGVFIPYLVPDLTEQISDFRKKSFSDIIASVLNLFFSCKLSPRDVEICVGKNPLRITEISHRLIMSEGYHNPARSYAYIENNLYKVVAPNSGRDVPTEWFKVVARIATLFAAYGQLPATSAVSFDVCAYFADFIDPIAVWYARRMGLPVGTIICCCRDDGSLWDFIQRGELNTSAAFPDCITNQIEGIIRHHFGLDITLELLNATRRKAAFSLNSEMLSVLRNGLTAAVIGSNRIQELSRSVKTINKYTIDDCASVCYGSVQDYRAVSGKSRHTLIFVDSLPKL